MGSGPYDQDFAYSAIHNITSFDGASYTYGTGNASGAGDAGPHAVTSISAGAVTFGYDDNGNRITRTENTQTTSYAYGDDNRLDQVTLPDTSTVEFVYDADGNRVSRANGDDSTRYVVGLMEIDLDQTTVTETRTFYSFAGTSVAVRAHTVGTVAYSFGNHLGSPVAAFEDTTNTVSRMGYEPYGTERAVTGVLPSDHRFTNQIADNTTHPSGGTGLLFYNARYYDPQVGAFVAADTLIPDPTSPVDFNRYAYVRDNPVNHTDPTGHWCILGTNPNGSCRGARQARSAGRVALGIARPVVSAVGVGACAVKAVKLCLTATGAGFLIRRAQDALQDRSTTDRVTKDAAATGAGHIATSLLRLVSPTSSVMLDIQLELWSLGGVGPTPETQPTPQPYEDYAVRAQRAQRHSDAEQELASADRILISGAISRRPVPLVPLTQVAEAPPIYLGDYQP